MGIARFLRSAPPRVASGAYILHEGFELWNADDLRAKHIHHQVSGAYGFLDSLDPQTLVKLMSVAEMVTGSMLLMPFVRNRTAGFALTAFASGVAGLYWMTDELHRPRSVWPTQEGIPVSKDLSMIGVGLGLIADRK